MTAKSFMLEKHKKFENTRPELVFAQMLKDAWIYNWIAHPKDIEIPSEKLSLRVDGIFSPNIVTEILGPYHLKGQIQPAKTKWRTNLLIKAGYRVLLIESELLICRNVGNTKMFHPYLVDQIKTFRLSSEPFLYLRA